MLLSRLSRSSPRSSDTTAPWWGDMHEVGVRVGDDVMCGCVPVSLSVFLPHSHSISLCSPGLGVYCDDVAVGRTLLVLLLWLSLGSDVSFNVPSKTHVQSKA